MLNKSYSIKDSEKIKLENENENEKENKYEDKRELIERKSNMRKNLESLEIEYDTDNLNLQKEKEKKKSNHYILDFILSPHKPPKKKILFLEKLKELLRRHKKEAIEREKNLRNEKKYKRRSTYVNTIKDKKKFTSDQLDELNKLKLQNNIIIGFCYSISEVINTKEFNMERIKSFGFKELKSELLNHKNEYKKLVKDQRRGYLSRLITLANKFKGIIEKKLEDIGKTAENQKLIKILNSCLNKPKISIYSNFSEDELDIALKCLANNWEYPPYEYYTKLYHTTEAFDKENFASCTSLINIQNERDKFKEKDKIKDINNSNLNLNLVEDKKDKEKKNLNIKGLLQNGTLFPTINLKKNSSFLTVYEDLNKITTESYMYQFYLEVTKDIENILTLYENEISLERYNKIGQYIKFEDLMQNFNNYITVFKNQDLRVKKNFDINWINYKEDLFQLDKTNRVFIISIKQDYLNDLIINDNNNNIIKSVNNKGNLNSNNNNNKNQIQIQNQNQKNSNNNNNKILINKTQIQELIIDYVKLAEENKINKLIKDIKNYPKDKITKVLVEFSSNNGNYLEDIELNYYIIFDIFELNSNININNTNQNEKNSIDNLKPIAENVYLKGFYDIYYREIFEQNKEYVIFIKSYYCPFGYNLCIYCEYGTINSLSYDKYLTCYCGMNLINNYVIPIPNLYENSTYLLAKFRMKLNKPIINKLIKMKFNITISQDFFISQFVDFYIQKFRYNQNDNILKGDIAKKLDISDVFNLNLKDLDEKDEIIVIKIFNFLFLIFIFFDKTFLFI